MVSNITRMDLGWKEETDLCMLRRHAQRGLGQGWSWGSHESFVEGEAGTENPYGSLDSEIALCRACGEDKRPCNIPMLLSDICGHSVLEWLRVTTLDDGLLKGYNIFLEGQISTLIIIHE